MTGRLDDSNTSLPDTAEYEPDVKAKPSLLESRALRYTVIALGGLLLLSIVQAISGTSELTSPGTWAAAVRLAIPIMLAGLGGLFSERAGVVNIGLEGMMIAGTWFGAWAGWSFGPWYGVLFGLLGGAVFGLIHAVATVTFAVDHIVSGVAINILAGGAMRFLSVTVYDVESGGGATQSPKIKSPIGTFDVPLLSDAFNWLEEQAIFFISDVSGVLAGFTTRMSWLTLVTLLIVPLTWWVLWRTAWGLRLRSCGENPYAAESLGVSVLKMKYYGVVISGALAGLGGAYLVVVQAGIYREGMTAGRGFIGLASLIFGNWYPFGVAAGSAVFGYADALSLRQATAVHALLLVAAIGLAALTAWSIAKKQTTAAIVQGVAAAFFLGWYLATDTVPTQVVAALPYLVTLLVLSLATQRLRMPAADGLRYRKGEAV
ncbi:MAG: ABC transporter permease [Actinomycetota bacterium]|nr:ABC transporter permease [Actinomycetota bacterium]